MRGIESLIFFLILIDDRSLKISMRSEILEQEKFVAITIDDLAKIARSWRIQIFRE